MMNYDKEHYPHGWDIKIKKNKLYLQLKNSTTKKTFELPFDSWIEIYALLNDASIMAILKNAEKEYKESKGESI